MNRTLARCAVGICFAAIGLDASAASHQGFISRGHGGGVQGPGANQTKGPDGGQTAATPKTDTAKASDQTATPAATTEPAFVAGQAEIQKAQVELARVTAKLRSDFEQTPDFTAALAEQKQARSDYAGTMKNVADALANNPDYAAAVNTGAAAEAKLASARVDAPDTVPQLATDVMKARSAVKAIELKSGEKDDTVIAAKAKVTAADEKVAKLRAGFDASMRSNADYVAAKATLDAARGIKTASAK